MKSLKNQQSKVKNQGQNPQCVLYSTASAIEEAMIKAGNPGMIDVDLMERESKDLVIEWKPGDKYGAGSVDKALVWAKNKGYIDGYQWIDKSEFNAWIDRGYSVIFSLSGYPNAGRDLYHNVLGTGYGEGKEFKNSWGEGWGDKGYGIISDADFEKYVTNPCYIVITNGKIPVFDTNVFIKPVDAPITQGYGESVAYYNTKALGYTLGHPGIDFGCPVGTPVKCARDGILLSNRVIAGALVMTVQHDIGTTEYWHLKDTIGLAGEKVKQCQIICHSGNSGQFVIGNGHLHFEYHPKVGGDGKMNGASDPTSLFSKKEQTNNQPVLTAKQQALLDRYSYTPPADQVESGNFKPDCLAELVKRGYPN